LAQTPGLTSLELPSLSPVRRGGKEGEGVGAERKKANNGLMDQTKTRAKSYPGDWEEVTRRTEGIRRSKVPLPEEEGYTGHFGVSGSGCELNKKED
jgi:hypothetical protein